MKSPQRSTLLITILFLVVSGCTPEGEDIHTHACKLTQISFTTSFATGDSEIGVSNFSYNDQGLLTDMTSLTEAKDNLGLLKSSNTSEGQYEYNADGYLVKSTSESEYRVNSDDPYTYSSSSIYQYQEGRLIKISSESISGQLTYLYTYAYDYDANGKLSKYTLTTTFADKTSSNAYDFKTQKVTMIGFTGAETEGELDSDGFLTKEINVAGVERRYQYSNEGNLVRQEEWTDDKMYHAVDFEYDDKMNPNNMVSYLTFKGMPDLKMYRAIYPIHNYTKETDYKVDTSDNEVVNYTKVHTIQYNSSEHPITIETSKSDNTEAVISTTNTTYTYKDCE